MADMGGAPDHDKCHVSIIIINVLKKYIAYPVYADQSALQCIITPFIIFIHWIKYTCLADLFFD